MFRRAVYYDQLFLIFINDFLHLIQFIHMLMTPFYILQLYFLKLSTNIRPASRFDTISSLNDDLERIASWRTDNLVNINDQKTLFKSITLSYIEDNPYVIFKNIIIEPTKTFHMLGLIVSSNLSWKPYIGL